MVFTFSDPTTWADIDFTNGNLSTTALGNMTAVIASQITSTQMGNFSADQIGAFPTSAVSGIVSVDGIDASAISSIKVTGLIESQIKLLTTPQIYELASTKKLSDFNTDQLGYLTFAQTKQLTYSYTVSNSDTSGIAQLKEFTPVQVRVLAHITHAEILTTEVISEQLSTSSDYWMQKLNASQLGSLSTAQLQAIVAGQFSKFSGTQMGGFTAAQLPSLSLDQFKAITGTDGSGSNDASESLVSSIAGITPSALVTIPASYFASITEVQLGALTTSQIPVLTTDTTGQVANLNGGAVNTSTPVPSTDQMAVFTAAQAGFFASATDGFFNSLSATQVNALAEDSSVSRIASVPAATINNIKPSVIYGLDATTTGSLTAGQLAVLDTYSTSTADSYDQVQALNVADLKSNIVNLSATQISKLTYAVGSAETYTSINTYGQIGDLTTSSPNQINLLSSTDSSSNLMVAGFTTSQINVVSNDQFLVIHANAFAYFSDSQIAAFQNKNINSLSTAQFAKITSTNIVGFRYTKETSETVTDTDKYGWIQAISTDRIKELTSSQFSGLTTYQIPGLSLAQVAVLPSGAVSSTVPSSAQIQAFTVNATTASNSVVPNQVASLPAAYVDAFSVAQLNNFTYNTQFPEVSQAAIKGLSNTQLAGLDSDHVGALTQSQLITLDSTDSNYNAWTSTTTGQVASLTASSITTAQLSNSTAGFDTAQISNFSASQTGVFTSDQLQKIIATDRLNNFIASNFMSTLPLSAWQISQLNFTNMGLLTTAHLVSLTTTQKVAAITITAISSAKVSSLATSKLTYGARTTISRSTDETNAGASADASVIPQIEFMSEAQVQALDISDFTEGQVQALHIPYVTATQIASPFKVGYLSVQGTTANALKIQADVLVDATYTTTSGVITGITAASKNAGAAQGQIEQLSAAQIRGFTTSQIPKLTAVQLQEVGGFTQQQMKYFKDSQVKLFSSSAIYQKDGTTSDVTTYVNQFAAMGDNLLSLPYSQYALVSAAITLGITSNQTAKENDYHLLARTKTVTSQLASVVTGLTAGDTTYDITAKSTFAIINAVPTGILHMLNAEQVALVNATNITTILADANYQNMSQEARDVLSNNILGWSTTDAKWSTLDTHVNMSEYGYMPSTASSPYKYPPVDQLSRLSDAQIGVLTAAALNKMKDASSELQINAIPDWSQISTTIVNSISSVFTENIMTNLTSAHYQQLTEATILNLSSTLFAAIPAARIADLTSSGFTSTFAHTAIITAAQAGYMTTAQLNALASIGSLIDTAVAAAFSSTAVTVSSITEAQIQALGTKIVQIAAAKFGSITSTAFASPFSATSSITAAQAEYMTTAQLNALASIGSLINDAVAAAFSSSAVSVSTITAAQIKALGTKIAQIADDKFSSVNLSTFENVSSITALQAAQLNATQAGQILVAQIPNLSTTTHIPNFPVATFSGFVLLQIQEMSSEQINAASSLGKRRLMLVLDGAISALDIDLTGFNTSVIAGLLSSLKKEDITVGDSDATVQVKMTTAKAKEAFKYAYGSDGKVRLYVDKSNFELSHQHSTSSSVSGLTTTATSSDASTDALKWNGNVTSAKSISGQVDPLTWDFIHHVAKETYGNYRFSALFTDVNTSESTLNTNINSAVNTVVYPILNAFDITDSVGQAATGVTFTKNGSAGDYYTEIDPNVETSVTGDKYNIPSTIFNNLYKEQPERFTTATGETADPTTANEKQSMPFMTNDTLNFLITITPNSDQRVLDTTAGMAGGSESTGSDSTARVKARIYKMQIVIE